LILGCNLAKFRSGKGAILPEKGRPFAILVSVAWHLIWNLQRGRVIEDPDRIQSTLGIHNQWLKAINAALTRDRLLTNKIKFGPLALKKQLVLNTWSCLLMDEDSLPDDGTNEGVLVGIRPMTGKHGIGSIFGSESHTGLKTCVRHFLLSSIFSRQDLAHNRQQ
jgi:ribonuclease HI